MQDATPEALQLPQLGFWACHLRKGSNGWQQETVEVTLGVE
jgi:hypothetical protein